MGEWCIWEGEVWLIIRKMKNDVLLLASNDYKGYDGEGLAQSCTPILHWETIEGVLEKAGYQLEFVQSDTFKWRAHILSDFKQRDILSADFCDSRQEAVDLAVLELGKELK